MNASRHARANAARGFTLVEVTLALGIAVFCLVVVFGLLNVGLNTSSSSMEQSVATNILSAVAGDLRAAPTPAPGATSGVTTVVYKISIPLNAGGGTAAAAPISLDESGQPTLDLTAARFRLDTSMTPGTSRNATQARIVVSWPWRPAGATAPPAGSVESFLALDRN